MRTMLVSFALMCCTSAFGQELAALDIEAGYCIGVIRKTVETNSREFSKFNAEARRDWEAWRQQGIDIGEPLSIPLDFDDERKWLHDFQTYLKVRNATFPNSASIRMAIVAIRKGEQDAAYCDADYKKRLISCRNNCPSQQSNPRARSDCIITTCSVDKVMPTVSSCAKPNACKTLSARLPM